MKNTNTIVSLELLLLNDLFRRSVIDQDIFESARKKIIDQEHIT